MVPTGEHFPVREKSENFTPITGKIGKNTEKNRGNLSASNNSENPANIVPYLYIALELGVSVVL